MTIVYVDTSAALKRLLREPESGAFGAWADRGGTDLVATPLLETELRRTAHRAGLAQAAVTAVLDGVAIYDLPRGVFVEAGQLLPGRPLRSLDALHLASALQLGVDAIATYDTRLSDAAGLLGMAVVAPR